MRDLKSYFRSNAAHESTNSPKNHDNMDSEANFLSVTHADHKSREDDSIASRSKRRRSPRTKCLSKPVEDNSNETESNDELNTRKKRRRKSTVQKSDHGTRVLQKVVIKDCLKSPMTSVDRKRGGCKRRQNESDQSELEITDSSEDLFETPWKERPRRTYSRKSASTETKEANNLFNYFVKAEKAAVEDDKKLQESPVDCMKRVKVVAQIHSPPRDRSDKLKRAVKNSLSPVVKLRRTRVTKNLDLDLIEVIETENVTPQKTNPKSKQEDQPNSSNDGDCEVFKNAKRARVCVKRLVLEDSDEPSESEKESSRDSPVGDIEDPVWRMRVQFTAKTKTPSGPKKSKSRITNGSSSSEEEAMPEEKKSESKAAERRILPRNRFKQKEPLKQPKLAPLFCKQHQKKSDNVVNVCDEARKLFLHSGLPEVVKKKFEEQKNVSTDEEPFTCYKFPTVTHVLQKSENVVQNVPEIDLRLKPIEDGIVSNCQPFVSFINMHSESVSYCDEQEYFDLKDELATLKKQERGTNVGDTYSSIQRLYKEAEKNDTICWTDKYKPSNCDDLVGNKFNLMKLKEWIESHKRRKIVYSDYDSSEEEFVDSDDSGRHSKMKDNLAILAGPSGCGKTCAVYMLAKELGFEVLEVNAASNRDGKRLLDELLEATQSHRVKRATIFEKAAEDKKPSRKKRKKKKSREEKRERKTMSLILIEDADILFENYDEGFVSALNTLARESKRPLILTANNVNCPHLNRYRHNLILRFECPSRSSINTWLKVIALTEGVKLSDAVLVDLFHIAGSDVRKNLLQLQMLISSKFCRSTLDGEKLFYQDWCRRVMQGETRRMLPVTDSENNEDDLFSPKKGAAVVAAPETHEEESSACETSHSDRDKNARLLNDHAKLMRTVTLLEQFHRNPDGSVLPGTSDALHEDPLSADIVSFLKQKVFSDFKDSKSSVSFGEYYSPIDKYSRIRTVCQNVLSNLSVPLFDRYAKYCDLLPTLRNITRVEQTKQSNQQRKTSRYFSYLKSVNIHINDQEVEFLRESMI